MYSCQNRPANYSLLSKGKFPEPNNGVYFWHLQNFTKDMDKYQVILSFEKAMNLWQRAMDIIEPVGNYITFQGTPDISKAHFIFSFGEGVHQFSDSENNRIVCPFNFDGSGKVLAHAWSKCESNPYGGQLHLDESEDWSNIHAFDKTELLTVILHEIGHILDLAHSDDVKSLMYPQYNGPKSISPDDVSGLAYKFKEIKYKVSGIPYKNKSLIRRLLDFLF